MPTGYHKKRPPRATSQRLQQCLQRYVDAQQARTAAQLEGLRMTITLAEPGTWAGWPSHTLFRDTDDLRWLRRARSWTTRRRWG